MERKNIKRVLLRLLCLVAAVAWGGAAWAQTGNFAKIDPELQELIHQSRDANETFRVIIEMAEQYDNSNLERGTAMMTRAQRRDFVVNELKRFSEQSQIGVVDFLIEKSGRGQVNVLHRFWIFNGVCCEATANCIGELSTRQDVRYVSLDKEMELIDPIEEEIGDRSNSLKSAEWHISKVRANKVWNELGYTGAGVLVAIIDSGVNYNHPDLKDNMWDGVCNGETLYPNHGWDFSHNDNDPMDFNPDNPYDVNIDHGSLVAGILAGKRGTGVAPNATIMALAALASDNAVLSSIEFALEHGADVLNLSLGRPGVGGIASFRLSFVNVMYAGVVAAVAAGNYGEPDSLAKYPVPNNVCNPGNCPPPWHNPDQEIVGGESAVICIGNTTENDMRNNSSSIGPVSWMQGDFHDYPYIPPYYNGLIRPDISAPGTNINALSYDETQCYMASGTSSATPCVAGIIALMLEANPNLTPAQIDEILETTAVPCENQTHKNSEYGSGRVDAYKAVKAALRLRQFTVAAVALPQIGGTIEGGGNYLSGEQCTLTATPNPGYAFQGWFNSMDMIVSPNRNYTFTVLGDRYLIAKFASTNYTITLNASPTSGGTISGGGTYPAGSMVTLTATAASGYSFNGWVENGILLTNATTYMFTASADRNITATFVSKNSGIGSVVTNADGSQGVLYHFDASGVGWMVALDDASEGCTWGPTTNVQLLPDRACDNVVALEDLSGFRNTGLIRTELGTDNDYAASQVDFDHGWYLPSAGQLRKLYSALPFIDSVLYQQGGSTISEDTYWSSTEYSSADAATPMFAMSNSNKGTNHRVRAIRNYYSPQDNMIIAMPDSPTRGTVMNYHNGVYSYGENAAVVAQPKPGYLFDHWSEEGLPVSYNRNYTFTFTHSRRLTAHFTVSGGVGTVVHNADGSDGVVFYMNTDGTEGLMVALEDASEGCPWGPATNVMTLNDRPLNDIQALEDLAGFKNTGVIRDFLDNDTTYAAGKVDFENGWYLPSSGELRKLYAALPMIETALVRAGGSTLTEDTYWSSTEYSTSDASTPMFSMGNTNKTSTCRVRAIRKFLTSGTRSIVAKSCDTIMGTVTGSGNYDLNATVTVTAQANSGYIFDHWSEDGLLVSFDAQYQFPFTRNRTLVAHFIVSGAVGSIVNNADGSKGVVFYQNPEGTEGWMVALNDASEGCAWGPTTNINAMPDMPYNDIRVLEDVSGYRNTDLIRKVLGTNNDYAASVVDFDNGWYLPAAGQLRKLYAVLPMIEQTLLNAGGTLLTEDAYWSSTECSSSDAYCPMFAMSTANKADSLRVRAVRSFIISDANAVTVKPNNAAFGSVSGSGVYQYGTTVTVTASAYSNYMFDHWAEDGCVVSYAPNYSFLHTRTRSLEAVFVREHSVGSIVHNDDGTKGIVFYSYPSGIGGLMVALEDASEGCPWGLEEDVPILDNQSPSAVMDLLEDMRGKSNTNRIRQWYSDNAEYAACKTDYANGWYLPSAGQLRKLYAALPLIEAAIVNAGGTIMTEDAYWSSTEQSASNAWTPSFAMSSSNKTGNYRVRAIRSLTDTETVLADVNIEGGGTVTGAGRYDHGQTCILRAQANESFAFLNWTCGGTVVSTNREYSFTVLGNQTYTANFVANSSNITTAFEPANSGTVTGAGVYTIGSNCTLKATPHTGYSFVNWTKNGSVVSTNSSYSFTVTESAQYTAHFVINSYAVNATAFPEEGGTVSGAHAYTHGSTAILTATAAEGYTFVNWMENGVVLSNSPNYHFVVSGDRTLQANFSNSTFTVTAVVYPMDAGTVEGTGGYENGDIATLTAHANAGYTFFCWFEDDDVLSFDPVISFEVTDDYEIYVLFVKDASQTISLASGWNWFSTYLEISLEDLKNALVDTLGNTAIQIKSKDKSTTYNGSQWRGTLNTMDVIRMYKIKTTAACEITLTGTPINPEERPITINNGANWIGFPSSASMSLGNAFSGFAISGDIIKSKDHYSSFNGSTWRGTFNTLEPGKGYVYKSKASGNRTFTFPLSH